MKQTYKQKLVNALAQELFGNCGTHIKGGADTIWTLNKLNTSDLEYLFKVFYHIFLSLLFVADI